MPKSLAAWNVKRYFTDGSRMIRSFRSKPLRMFFETGRADKLPASNDARISRMLRALHVAIKPEDLNLPGYYFHGLQGQPRWSIRVTANWRITFGWDAADAIDIDLEDYH